MRYDKTAVSPEGTVRLQRVGFLSGEKGLAACFDVRPTENGLVRGEGAAALSSFPSPTRIYLPDGKAYVYDGGQKSLTCVETGVRTAGIPTEPVALLPQVTEAGVEGTYCLEKDALRYLRSGSVVSSFPVGGTCAAVHRGRLFVAQGTRLRFSSPYSEDGVTQTGRDPDGAGYIDLDLETGKGDVVALVSFRDKLYLFRERGISRMRAEGEALDFSITAMPFSGGRILQGTVAACGDRICYFGEDGLYAFDGSDCKILSSGQGFSPVRGFAFGGGYGVEAVFPSGERAVYAYDFARGTGRFLTAEGMTSAEGEYFLAGGSLYRFSDGEVSKASPKIKVALTGSPRSLRSVTVEGEGDFVVSADTAEGSFAAKGGEKVRFAGRRATRTEITVAAAGEFCIRALDVAWRIEDDD